MANENMLRDMLLKLAKEGINFGDILKEAKSLKDAGQIKSKGRGKSTDDDPIRVAIREVLLANSVKWEKEVEEIKTGKDGKEVKGTKKVSGTSPLLDLIVQETGDETVSYMLTLNKDWKVNFIKNIVKAKKDKTEEPTAPNASQFEETAVV